jgi:hypothetical protein
VITVGETYLSDAYEVLNSAGDPTTGTLVTVDIVLPDRTVDTATPAEPAPGVYTFAYTTGVAGRHEFSVKATQGFLGSTVVELGGDVFNVESSATAGGLVGLRDVKERLGIERDIVDDDEQLRRMIVSASQLVEAETRVWHRCTVSELLHPGRVLVLSSLPVVSVTSLAQVGSDPIDATSFQADAAGVLAPLYGVWPWAGWPNSNQVLVTYEAGEEVVPAAVQEAVLVTVDEMWSAQRGPANLPLADDEASFEATVGYALPAAAQKMLEPWRALPGIA